MVIVVGLIVTGLMAVITLVCVWIYVTPLMALLSIVPFAVLAIAVYLIESKRMDLEDHFIKYEKENFYQRKYEERSTYLQKERDAKLRHIRRENDKFYDAWDKAEEEQATLKKELQELKVQLEESDMVPDYYKNNSALELTVVLMSTGAAKTINQALIMYENLFRKGLMDEVERLEQERATVEQECKEENLKKMMYEDFITRGQKLNNEIKVRAAESKAYTLAEMTRDKQEEIEDLLEKSSRD